jgi:hypothetical protein
MKLILKSFKTVRPELIAGNEKKENLHSSKVNSMYLSKFFRPDSFGIKKKGKTYIRTKQTVCIYLSSSDHWDQSQYQELLRKSAVPRTKINIRIILIYIIYLTYICITI